MLGEDARGLVQLKGGGTDDTCWYRDGRPWPDRDAPELRYPSTPAARHFGVNQGFISE